MDDDMGILEETALEEAVAALEEDELDDSFPFEYEYEDYGYEDYEPSPYDGTYSED